MSDINYFALVLVIGFTIAVYVLCCARLRDGGRRFFLASVLAGLCFYSGIGAAFVPVLWEYLLVYGAFVTAIAATYVFVVKRAGRYAQHQSAVFQRIEALSANRLVCRTALIAYLATSIVPLLYPEFRLPLLWHPPLPDLLTVLNHGVALEPPVLLKLNTYAGIFLWPFYLLALYSLRRRYVIFAFCVLIPGYARYCAVSYLGRGELMMCLALYLATVWLDRPALRVRIALIILTCLPFLLVVFGMYSRLRLGDLSAASGGANEQVQGLLDVETTFPRYWDTLTADGRHADLGSYLTWLITLPVPKLLTGEIHGARINEEISGVVSDIYPGQAEFSYTLTGPVIESVYIYGNTWFWIHAATIGALAGLLCAFAGGCRSLLLVLVHYSLIFGYTYARAGIEGAAPFAVNSYMSLYLVALLLALVTVPRRSPHMPDVIRFGLGPAIGSGLK